MLDARLSHQARARALTAAEVALAAALEEIFAAGTHDFAAVAALLDARNLPRPSGSTDPWTVDLLTGELAAINASLDAHYARDGIGV